MTLVYRYGLLAPTAEEERINEQISLAHRYRNQLVELELARRAEITKATMTEALLALDVRIEKAEKPDRKALYEERKAALKARRAEPEVKKATEAANERYRDQVREARGACGVFWGTYLIIEAAAESAAKSLFEEPRFARWTGDGAVAVQLQKGLSVEDASNGEDTRLQLNLAPQPVPGRGGKPLPRIRLRIGSEGRDPIFAEWPLIYHRPLPEGAVIKWAKVLRRKAASRDVWSLHLTITTDEAKADPATTPAVNAVAVDLGWKQAERNDQPTTRAGGWHDGKTGGDIILEPEINGRLRKAEDIRSIRDQSQNELQKEMVRWVHIMPEEHKEKCDHLAQWKSPGRFAALAIWWRDHRFVGDAYMFGKLEEWRKRDKHLWLYETGTRSRALLRRREQYRVFAAQLARRYDTLIIERLKLDTLAEIPEPGDGRESHPKARKQRFDTAPSELRTALTNAFRAKRIVTVKPTGPAETLFALWREGQSEERKAAPARSARFNRLRKIKPENPPGSEGAPPPLAN